MKKKILFISETLSGGVRKHILDLLLNLNKNKYKIHFIYGSKRMDEIFTKNKQLLKERGIKLYEVTSLDRNIGISDIKAFIKINKIVKNINPSILHCHSSKAGVIGRICAKINNIKYVYYTPHAYFIQDPEISKIKFLLVKTVESVLSKKCTDLTINVSAGEKEFAVKNNLDCENKFKVIYNGIKEDGDYNSEYIEQLKIKFKLDGKIIIGVAARLDKQKDPWTFIKIAENIIKKHENVKFVYIGDGDLKNEIKKYITKKDLLNRIVLLGFRNDVEAFLEIFDIYFITSLYEGLPYSLIEATKFKLPIIGSDTIGINEIVINGINGLLFERKDIKEGINKLDKLINSNLYSMKENSFRIYKQNFTLEKMIKRYEKLYS